MGGGRGRVDAGIRQQPCVLQHIKDPRAAPASSAVDSPTGCGSPAAPATAGAQKGRQAVLRPRPLQPPNSTRLQILPCTLCCCLLLLLRVLVARGHRRQALLVPAPPADSARQCLHCRVQLAAAAAALAAGRAARPALAVTRPALAPAGSGVPLPPAQGRARAPHPCSAPPVPLMTPGGCPCHGPWGCPPQAALAWALIGKDAPAAAGCERGCRHSDWAVGQGAGWSGVVPRPTVRWKPPCRKMCGVWEGGQRVGEGRLAGCLGKDRQV